MPSVVVEWVQVLAIGSYTQMSLWDTIAGTNSNPPNTYSLLLNTAATPGSITGLAG